MKIDSQHATVFRWHVGLIPRTRCHGDVQLRMRAARKTCHRPQAKRLRSCSEEAERLLPVADEQILRLLIVVEHHLVGFTPDARLLVSAEGRMRRIRVVAVRPHATGVDRAAEAVSPRAVPCPDPGARPYTVSLAISSASSSVLNVVTETTGPKISSWNTRILL